MQCLFGKYVVMRASLKRYQWQNADVSGGEMDTFVMVMNIGLYIYIY